MIKSMNQNNSQQSILALGFFDGVHLGHAALLQRARERAAEGGCIPAALTFDVHPDALVKGQFVELLNSVEDREKLMTRLGMERVVRFAFTRQSAAMDWRSFLDRMRAEQGAAGFVVGHDFRFGRGGEGDPEKLRAYCAENGLSCDVIPAVRYEGEIVSSTAIRALLRAGDAERAAVLLGHPHLLSGTVLHGFQNGRTMDFPTANLALPEGVLCPRHGVYVSRVRLPDGGLRGGVTNVGVRPTFGGKTAVSVETHLLDFSGDLYGKALELEFLCFLRPEMRFDGPEALKAQIASDARIARERWQR